MPRVLEFGFIGLMLLIVGWTNPWSANPGVGQLVLNLSVVFLLQTLVRDLYLYYKINTRNKDKEQGKQAQCFCVESGIGILAVLIGLSLFGTSFGGKINLGINGWLGLLGLVMIANYLFKDLVFSWNPWRIYRDPDHLNIIPRFKV